MTATAPLVAPAMEAPATPASFFALVSLVAAPLVLAGAALWVLADADRLDAAAIVRGLLVVAFAAAGRAAWSRSWVPPGGDVVVDGAAHHSARRWAIRLVILIPFAGPGWRGGSQRRLATS